MIIATAGHVDHGKTCLIKALTGVDTDTLSEEKRRGLTIDIGFAYLPLAGLPSIGFIDVPGHDRFIKNAICGFAATDYLLLVVAADDGPMPQTAEHMAIIDLLGVTRGAMVISKIDRVDSGRIAQVAAALAEQTRNTPLAAWPVLPVSGVTGEGINELRDLLRDEVLKIAPVPEADIDRHNFRLAIDRKFEKKGTGLIVTGTVFSGRVRVGDRVTIAGSGMPLRVRGLRVQDDESRNARQGQRGALNLAGSDVDKKRLGRGNWVVSNSVAGPVSRFDAEIRVLPGSPQPLRHWMPVHLHLGTTEITARIALLEGRSINGQGTGLVQVVTTKPVGAVFGDRFIIRDQSARITLGGGRVIDIFPPRRGRAKPTRLSRLRKLNNDDVEQSLADLLSCAADGVDLECFQKNRNLAVAASELVDNRDDVTRLRIDGRSIAFLSTVIDAQLEALLQSIAECHRHFPGKSAFSETDIRGNFNGPFSASGLRVLLECLRERALIRVETGGYALARIDNTLTSLEQERWAIIFQAISQSGFRALTVAEIEEITNAPGGSLAGFLSLMVTKGMLVPLSAHLFTLPNTLRQMWMIIGRLAGAGKAGGFSVAEFRDGIGVGRNRCIEMLDGLDARGITRRFEQRRFLQPRANELFEKLIKVPAINA